MAPEPTENEVKYREKIEELQVEREKLSKRITYWHNRLKKELERKYDFVSKMTVKDADWKEILEQDHPETKVKYEVYNKLMHELGFWPGGYYQETMQRIIKIMIRRTSENECIKKTMQSLKIIIPHIKPIKCKNGRKYKVIQIFCDHEGGIPELVVKNDGKMCIAYTRYHRFELLTKWDTLKNTMLDIGLRFAYED